MKEILISIQRPHTDNIRALIKTVEVRKNKPTIPTPFPVLIYETKAKGGCGKVIGEFVCDRITEYKAEFTDLHYFNAMGKSVALNEIKRVAGYDEDGEPKYYYETSNEEENPDDCKLLKESCLTFNELRQYIGNTFYDKSFYGWHISDLKIYDKPKSLEMFPVGKIARDCGYGNYNIYDKILTRPPQSWCYVEAENA